MKLGAYTFGWVPDRFTIPKPEKHNAHVLTFSSVAYFTWGMSIIGKIIELEWDFMSGEQFYRLQSLLDDDESKVWDLETTDRIWYGDPVNHPFVLPNSITSDGGATAELLAIDTRNNNLSINEIIGTFIEGENFHDASIPQKTGVITAIEILPDYNVELLNLEGVYFENMQLNYVWRQDVKLTLLITSEAT